MDDNMEQIINVYLPLVAWTKRSRDLAMLEDYRRAWETLDRVEMALKRCREVLGDIRTGRVH